MTQTEITQDIKNITSGFKTDGLSRIFEVLTWIHKNLKLDQNEEYKKEYFRTRTSEEIIKSKKLTGCTDYALVFLSLIRASGFEARYVEAIETAWLENGGDKILGHIFAEVLIGNDWFIVDPQSAVIRAWYGKRYVIYAKGQDSWDIGIRNLDDLRSKFLEYRNNESLKK
jgi:hypothetical protein